MRNLWPHCEHSHERLWTRTLRRPSHGEEYQQEINDLDLWQNGPREVSCTLLLYFLLRLRWSVWLLLGRLRSVSHWFPSTHSHPSLYHFLSLFSLTLSFYLPVCESVCLILSLSLSVFLSVCLCLCLTISVCQSVSFHIRWLRCEIQLILIFLPE